METLGRTFYSSSNGDSWLVVRDGQSGDIVVRHQPNAASGGQARDVALKAFLTDQTNTPQGKAFEELFETLKAEQSNG